MRHISDYFYRATDRTLYHYTSIDALLGIQQSRTMRAGHAYYLNDSTEILHAADAIKGACLRRAEVEALESERDFLRQFSVWLKTFQETPAQIFVLSLSEHKSLLSQWRAYTSHGKGVSLGFSQGLVSRMLIHSGFRIAKCLYESEEHSDLADSLVSDMLTTFRARGVNPDPSREAHENRYFSFLREYQGDILQVLAIIKHPAFREEAEWRVVSPTYERLDDENVKYMAGSSMLKPYIDIPLLPEHEGGYIFNTVTLGPTADANLSMSALSGFCAKHKLSREIWNSSIPYRTF